MSQPSISRLEAMLIRHEGLALKPYVCTAGRYTIGVGRNLDEVGISQEEAKMLLKSDVIRATSGALRAFPWFSRLTQARQDVIVSMIFNMGLGNVLKFKRMIAAIEKQDWEGAASEMQASAWASQVKKRAVELAEMMRTGEYPEPQPRLSLV